MSCTQIIVQMITYINCLFYLVKNKIMSQINVNFCECCYQNFFQCWIFSCNCNKIANLLGRIKQKSGTRGTHVTTSHRCQALIAPVLTRSLKKVFVWYEKEWNLQILHPYRTQVMFWKVLISGCSDTNGQGFDSMFKVC